MYYEDLPAEYCVLLCNREGVSDSLSLFPVSALQTG